MLLCTMNESEIKNEIQKEFNFLCDKINYRRERFVNQIKREKKAAFPICTKTDITTINNNKGYIVFIAECSTHCITSHATAYFIMRNHIGKQVLVEVAMDNKTIGSIAIYSAHFFERYAERLGLDVKGVSAIEHFITHYLRGTYHKVDGKIFEPYPFGVGLGTYNTDKTFMYINTFVSNELLFDNQQKIVDIIKNKYNASRDITTIIKY